MIYQGQVKNGVVVLDGEAPLPDGTLVRVEPFNAPANSADGPHQRVLDPPALKGLDELSPTFWQSVTIRDFAQEQDVPVVESLEDFVGGWPEDERQDDFEESLASWRERELEQDR